ncbi:DNA polymerase IV [Nocardioides sp.]|uniref:DNA polymerase IV n=1 Tax=Nocardioides sp. TaxID=35761 RepID=UPI002B26F48D|nr:DNA polymerase IV [Nocardioides sp.]
MATWVLHVDLDEFLAAVEVLRRPELAGLPVVVGGRGDPTERGVVSTASYAARAYGVRSGMPLRIAVRRCPEAVFLPVDKPVYEAASAEVMATLRSLTWDGEPVDVQVLGWDEAFVGPRAGATVTDPQGFAAHVRTEVLAATGLHCSVGIGSNTVQAKIATDFGKPRGTYRITDETWAAEMGDRPTRALWGVGPKTEKRLTELGLVTVAQLAEADETVLVTAFGPSTGQWLGRLARGRGATRVDPTPWVARAHGREETFQVDLDDDAEIEAAVRTITARAVADLETEGRAAAKVILKLRSSTFRTVTRSRTLPAPTSDPHVLADTAVDLLSRIERDRPVRLLGVRLEMVAPEGGYP